MNYFYYYKLHYFFDGEERSAQGITYGASWAEVVAHLTEYYGEEEISAIRYLKYLGEGGPCVEIAELKEVL